MSGPASWKRPGDLDDIEMLAIAGDPHAGAAVVGLVAEIRRLMAVVKQAEWAGGYGYECEPVCPWCDANKTDKEPHDDTCPAFTPGGEVR